MSGLDIGAARASDLRELIQKVERIEKAVSTMAWWLVQAQTGFAERDARGIEDILAGRGTGGPNSGEGT